MDRSGQHTSEGQEGLDPKRQVRKHKATHQKRTGPLGRWETPLLFLLCGSALLLWLLQDVGYHASWFTRTSAWVALGIAILSLGLLIISVPRTLLRRKREQQAASPSTTDQENPSQTPPEDKTFQQAMHEFYQRLTKAFTVEIHKRLENMMGHTIASLTTDIEAPALRERITEALLLIKILSLLSIWREHGHLKQVEYDELQQFIKTEYFTRAIDSPQ